MYDSLIELTKDVPQLPPHWVSCMSYIVDDDNFTDFIGCYSHLTPPELMSFEIKKQL